MSRSDVLVDADWIEANLDDPNLAIVEVDEDTTAYEKNHLNQAAIRTIRRVMVQREVFGKKLGGGSKSPRCTSAEGLVNTLKKESLRQKLLIKKTSVCESRLLFIVEAMRRLCGDEDFVTLLRAEKIETIPQELSQMMRGT